VKLAAVLHLVLKTRVYVSFSSLYLSPSLTSYQVPRSKNAWSYASTPQYASMAWTTIPIHIFASYICYVSSNFSLITSLELGRMRRRLSWFMLHYPSMCVDNTRVYPQVSGLAAWSENCKCAALCHHVQLFRYFKPLRCFSTNVYCCCLFRYRLSPETFWIHPRDYKRAPGRDLNV
jgi:hypothetical protein